MVSWYMQLKIEAVESSVCKRLRSGWLPRGTLGLPAPTHYQVKDVQSYAIMPARQSENQEKWAESEKWPLPCGDQWPSLALNLSAYKII